MLAAIAFQNNRRMIVERRGETRRSYDGARVFAEASGSPRAIAVRSSSNRTFGEGMIAIHYFEHDGTQHTVGADPGVTLMEAAVRNGVPGINADCGGACACATCHVYIPESWRAAVGEATSDELEMLDCSSGRQPNSRLSCQVTLTSALDGLRVDLPASQD